AYQIRDFLTTEHLRSVIVVTPGFRSKRSALVYHAVLDPVGIKVHCVPVFGQMTPAKWAKTWHGIQGVTEQFLKLQYYRFYVLWIHVELSSRVVYGAHAASCSTRKPSLKTMPCMTAGR